MKTYDTKMRFRFIFSSVFSFFFFLKGLVSETFFSLVKFFSSRQGDGIGRLIFTVTNSRSLQVATRFSRLSPGRRMKVDSPFTTTRYPDITRA